MMKKLFLFSLALFCTFAVSSAKVILPPVLDDDMVLQRNAEVKLWGRAAAGQELTVTPSWSGETYRTRVDGQGNWSLTVNTDGVGGPYTLRFSDGEELELRNILLGDVWFCSGQSNMEMPVKGFLSQPVEDCQDYILESEHYPDIRMFTLERAYAVSPQETMKGKWAQASLENTPDFSAIAYFFARTLNQVLDIPIGVIHSSWGGSIIEAWMSRENIQKYPHFKAREVKTEGVEPNHVPTLLYNAMIYPLRNLSVKGFTWYQGESNVSNYDQYKDLFTDMVKEWRGLFPGAEEAPFYFVQIAPFKYRVPTLDRSAYLREAQVQCLDVPNTGMAVTLDTGEELCIHPRKKEITGRRLAYQALAKTYHKKIVCDGPVLKETAVEDGKLVLTFTHADGGLCPLQEELDGFEVAGKDGRFYPAKAKARYGSKLDVWSDQVKEPCYVRYGFRNFVPGTLYNAYHLPASSFRTDDFPPVQKK